MKIWFTSDSHFSHANIIGFCDRPHSTAWDMNKDLTARWNEKVQPEDTIYHLGDFALGTRKSALLNILTRLNGRKILVPGNHDKCWIGRVKYPTTGPELEQRFLDAGFDEIIQANQTVTIDGLKVSHFPYADDNRHEHRHGQWRPVD
ncbi:MAG: metallophosphoesterase, partial [Promicromonosporaceae bacterium]|nr:metallophosphoesterase [Promicromonosporaceae bacterium]